MVVVAGHATAFSWVCLAGFLAYNCVRGPVLPDILDFAEVSTPEPSSTTLPGGGRRSAASTTPVLTTSTRFLQNDSPFETRSVSLDLTVLWSFLPASIAQCVGWLAAGLAGVSVGRLSRRQASPVLEPQAVALRAASRPTSPTKTAVAPVPARGGVLTPSTRKLRERNHGEVV